MSLALLLWSCVQCLVALNSVHRRCALESGVSAETPETPGWVDWTGLVPFFKGSERLGSPDFNSHWGD